MAEILGSQFPRAPWSQRLWQSRNRQELIRRWDTWTWRDVYRLIWLLICHSYHTTVPYHTTTLPYVRSGIFF